MIASRQLAFGSSKRKSYDTRIEYLESTGTQYIDTRIKTLSSSTVEVVAAATAFKSNSCLFGSIGADTTSLIRALVYQDPSQGQIISLQSGGYEVRPATITYDTFFHNYTVTPTKAEIDGKYYHSITRSDNSLGNFLLFAWYDGTVTSNAQARIARCKIYNSDILVHDFIPVRKGNIGYMYDRVSGQLFGNQGTGKFVLGPDIIGYRADDYIQDGLVAMFDGIENAGWGEHTDELKYVNLVTGKNYSFENSNNVLWGSDCLKILESGDRASGLRTGFYIKASELGISTDAQNYTIECALRAYDAEYQLISFDGSFGRTQGTASIDNFQGVIYSAYLSDTNTHQWGVNGDIRSKTNSKVSQEIFDGFYWDNREAYNSSAFRFGYTYTNVCRSDIHCARVYNRVLTVEEHNYNRNIDKARFGL